MQDHTYTAGQEDAHGHGHMHEHGHTYGADGHTHTHGHPHGHGHTHDPEQIRKVINRLSRSIGHLQKVRAMVEDGEDCSDVLIQLSAVRAELGSTGRLLLKEHMEHCIVDAVRENDLASVEKIGQVIDQFMK